MTVVIPSITPASYHPSALHAPGRDWPETNCYTDVWIEILHARGHDPAAGLGFTVAQDFEGDHFTFFKYPPEDLHALYGIRVAELAIYDSLASHIQEQISRGRMSLVEVDSFYLPDTPGAGYRQEHGKTTIGVNEIDPHARRMTYFHNAGFHALSGEDYDGAMGELASQTASHLPFPYVEFAKFDMPPGDVALEAVVAVLRRHLMLRPVENPLAAFQAVFADQALRLAERPPAFFHKYAFNSFRQTGANFELLADHLSWLAARQVPGMDTAIAACRTISGEAKIMQFQLARALARKRVEGLAARLDPMRDAYAIVIAELLRQFPDAA